MVKAIDHVYFFYFSDSRIVSHSPFAYNWQNRFWASEPIVAHFPSNKGGTSDIRIPRNSSELHLTQCMCFVCCVCGLGPSHMSKKKKCFVSYSFDSVTEAHESKYGHL